MPIEALEVGFVVEGMTGWGGPDGVRSPRTTGDFFTEYAASPPAETSESSRGARDQEKGERGRQARLDPARPLDSAHAHAHARHTLNERTLAGRRVSHGEQRREPGSVLNDWAVIGQKGQPPCPPALLRLVPLGEEPVLALRRALPPAPCLPCPWASRMRA